MSTLILTVGKNVLPVAVAGLYLLETQKHTHVLLVHSPESEGEASRFREFLGKRHLNCTVDCVSVDAGPGTDESRIKEKLKRVPGPFHFHYSGGTMPMVLKTIRAISSNQADQTYLSLHSNRLQDERGHDIYPGDLRRYYAGQFTVEDIAALHGWVPVTHCKNVPIAVMTHRLAELPFQETETPQWKPTNRLEGAPGEKMTVEIHGAAAAAAIPGLLPEAQASTGGDGVLRVTVDAGTSAYWDLRDYFLAPGRFELRVARALRTAIERWPEAGGCGSILRNQYFARKPKIALQKEVFEPDILFLFGYQLVLVSCSEGRHGKEKAFEAIHRARQLGGSGARAVVVSNQAKEHAREDQATIHLEIGLSESDRSLQIWGQSDTLADRFYEYLTELTEDKYRQ